MDTAQSPKPQLHPSEIAGHLQHRLRSGALMWCATGLSFALGLGSMAIDELEYRQLHWLRTALMGAGFAAAGLAYFAKENVIQKGLITFDAADISDSSRQQRYYELMSPQAQNNLLIDIPQGPYQPDLFSLGDLINEPRKYPHLIFLGVTGAGKTTLAEAIHALMPGQRVAVNPHWQAPGPGDTADFAYAEQVIGGGRAFADISEYMEGLHMEMDRRAKLTKSAMRANPFINVLVDELPAIAKNCPSAVEQLISLLFESRKFGIRLMVLAQADSVKILGLEGQGAVRENLTYIRLGDYAIDHAKWLVNKKQAEIGLIDWLQNQAYPCMIEDRPAVIPAISQGQFIGGAPTPPNGPGNGGNSKVTPDLTGNSGVTPGGNSLEPLPGKVLQFPGSGGVTGVTLPQNPALGAIMTAAAGGNLDGEFIKNELDCSGKYYAGARRILDLLTRGTSSSERA